MDKRLNIQVNCNRKISGVLRGFDAFMNIVLDETIEECKSGNLPMGTVVLFIFHLFALIIFNI
jgi:small nuclear ribonucleoprotein (snRNP)-like protein